MGGFFFSENQRILIESVQQENAKFAECQAMKDVTSMVHVIC
jgi:hypothetical protein